MSVTTATTDGDDGTDLTGLAKGLENDRPEDSRSCQHETCHGSLHLEDYDEETSSNSTSASQTNDDVRVVCGTCHCTPDGIFLSPESDTPSETETRYCLQESFFYPQTNPSGAAHVDDNPWGSRERERYRNSNLVKQAGGFEEVYNENDDVRPRGVDDEYTFDLSTL